METMGSYLRHRPEGRSSENKESKFSESPTYPGEASARSPMAPAWSFLLALLLLSCNAICSLGCHLPHTHSLANRRVLMLLQQLRRVSPSSCLQDRNDFAFPQEALGGSQLQKAQAISVLHEVTQHTFQLFSTEGSAAT